MSRRDLANDAPWRPILDGESARQALSTVTEIAAALGGQSTPRQVSGPSLYGGSAGMALLYGYLTRAGLDADGDERARTLLADAIASVGETPLPLSLMHGLAGVAWAVEHLQGATSPGEPDPCEAVDEILTEHLATERWEEDFDLLNGLVGLGVYALERLPRPAARACLERVVLHLAALARPDGAGVGWMTTSDLPELREKYPRGHYNLGVAHGTPGVIAFLGTACAAGVTRARPLLDRAVAWLLQHRMSGAAASFPYCVGPGVTPQLAQTTWCYGDPGVAAALLQAARAVSEPAWVEVALDVARQAARRPAGEAGVVDAALCHGAAGVGHLFNRMYQATGDPQLAEAARGWLMEAIARRRPGEGAAGYRAWGLVPGGKAGWTDEQGLVPGPIGIALALLAAATPIEPAWDRVLLVSGRTA